MAGGGSSGVHPSSDHFELSLEQSAVDSEGIADTKFLSDDNQHRLPIDIAQNNVRYLSRQEVREAASTSSTTRPLVQRRAVSANFVPPLSSSEYPSAQASFESPLRSILVSSPPTSSVSANTALASLSAAPSSSTSSTFAALANAGARRAASKPNDSVSSLIGGPSSHTPMLALEKDLDDPEVNQAGSADEGRTLHTSATLSRLFVADESLTPAPASRALSHLRTFSGNSRSLHETSTLTGHLFHHGFLEGRHSDITVYAFGEAYKLHKLLLDRVPFFSSAFSGDWVESNAREMALHPEDIDPNITKTAFELAIKRVYGTSFPIQEEQVAISLFATACWLSMSDLVETCVDAILNQMQAPTVHEFIKLVTNNYYGQAGDRILSSAKAMLCREGWEMPFHAWDNVPSEIVREIIGGDPFFVPSEWERWFLATKILNRKLKAKAIEAGLVSHNGQLQHTRPSSLRFFAVRFDTVYRRDTQLSGTRRVTEKDEAWISLYTSPEISPLLVLLDEGIHYVHLRFEQLQQIRLHRDVLGVPILPEKVISDALWMSMELRQRVLNANENDLELGLTEIAHEQEPYLEEEAASSARSSKGKQVVTSSDPEADDATVESNSWDGNGRPRKFWIPSNDVSCIMGGMRDANTGTSTMSGSEWNVQAARLSASLEPSDVTWASDFVLDSGRPASQNLTPPRYSNFPPFRFSAEFPSPRTLKEKKRVYSHTVFYLGSLWNLYIQRVNTSKNQQLGVYLHRASKESSPSDDPMAQVVAASVDDRIGQLEREMLMRKTERRNRHWRDGDLGNANIGGFGRRPASGAEERALLDDSSVPQKDEGPEQIRSGLTSPDFAHSSLRSPTSNNARLLESDAEDELLLRMNRSHNIPTIPPYLDGRPVIKTYFKIYSPDKNGRLLSIYESAPEKFVVSKSWGWKSSQTPYDEVGSTGYDISRSKDGKLRYMVVIGNV